VLKGVKILSLPSFNDDGLLPIGDYEVDIKELRNSIFVVGPPSSKSWDSVWRNELVNRLEILVIQLKSLGIKSIYVDGSFVEDKDHPNDIDGYFECDLHLLASGKLERDLNLIEPDKIWTWDPMSRKSYRGYAKKQLPMWHKYRVELYPHYGQESGIKDEFGNAMTFPAAFRKSRNGDTPKGIIKII
jgi:hypothetical protein